VRTHATANMTVNANQEVETMRHTLGHRDAVEIVSAVDIPCPRMPTDHQQGAEPSPLGGGCGWRREPGRAERIERGPRPSGPRRIGAERRIGHPQTAAGATCGVRRNAGVDFERLGAGGAGSLA
jgi:hypothetical protein